ncbi:MAG: hypothetical protein FWC57_05790 [Endomicrobia bacterium]|nr:hypothetical protein [Endomicrobiia bacterium]
MEHFFAFLLDLSEKTWQKFKLNAVAIIVLSVLSSFVLTPWFFLHIPLDSVPLIAARIFSFLCSFALVYVCWLSLIGVKTGLQELQDPQNVKNPFLAWLTLSAFCAALVFMAVIPHMFFAEIDKIEGGFLYNFLFFLFPLTAVLLFMAAVPSFMMFIFALLGGKNFSQAIIAAAGLSGKNKKTLYLTFIVIVLVFAVVNITVIGVVALYPFAILFLGQMYIDFTDFKMDARPEIKIYEKSVRPPDEQSFDARKYKNEGRVQKEEPSVPFEDTLVKTKIRRGVDDKAPFLAKKDITEYISVLSGTDSDPKLDPRITAVSESGLSDDDDEKNDESKESAEEITDISYGKEPPSSPQQHGGEEPIVEIYKDSDEEGAAAGAEEARPKTRNFRNVAEYGMIDPKKKQ